MLGNQAEERSRFCDSHGGCALGDPTAVLRNLSDKAVREAEEYGAKLKKSSSGSPWLVIMTRLRR
ncbi:hypothetical protein Syun_003700 [Stephania yunnanensis]|uniref:Uncharacterized protein n=1 Tax=Stephania yunnanensis TaxID=152371 RepID=A0AAP0L337_9MAGN